jgi:tetratricopeptide (TPR) repeat protein
MNDPSRTTTNVIHVAFGALQRPDELTPERFDPFATDSVPPPPAEPPADPVASLYTRAEVARIFAIDGARLRSWERSGLVQPSAEARGARYYTFQDLVAVRTAKDLIARGVPASRIRRAIEALRTTLPGTAPLSDLRIVSDGKSLAVRSGDKTFDPVTGQLLLDFDLGTLRDDVVRALPVTRDRRDARTAYDYFLEGCRLDGDDATRARAENAYRRAMQLDPTLVSAYTNLGTLRLLAGEPREAEALYRHAMALDPNHAEAPYNLGFMKLEDGEHAEAIELLTLATDLEPDFADAHFNLATALVQRGRFADALPHWSAYLELQPEGPFAAIAREHLRAR